MTLRNPRSERWTYAKSGVDRAEVSSALRALLAGVRYRPPPGHGRPLSDVGHFAGLVKVGRETLAITTDTVGTKIRLAEQLGRFEEIGEDIVGVNVNDLAAVGARAIGLVDVINCSRPDPRTFAALGRGINRGLARAEAALLGGETAVVPDLVEGYDVGGTAIGFFPDGRRPVTGARIRPGDRILGIPAHGFHANGFTLLRRLIDQHEVDLAQPRTGGKRPLGRELLRPTRIYCRASEALADEEYLHGLAHISGGGVRNLVRLHPGVSFVLDRWPEPRGVFAWAQSLGKLPDRELFETFNAGIGFAVIVAAPSAESARATIARAGYPDVLEVGHVERGRGVHLPDRDLSYEGYA